MSGKTISPKYKNGFICQSRQSTNPSQRLSPERQEIARCPGHPPYPGQAHYAAIESGYRAMSGRVPQDHGTGTVSDQHVRTFVRIVPAQKRREANESGERRRLDCVADVRVENLATTPNENDPGRGVAAEWD